MTRVSINSHRCFVVTFPTLHVYYIYIYQICIFYNSCEIHFGTIGNSLLQKRMLINKIIMRLVKL
jgi:hypothetical protein